MLDDKYEDGLNRGLIKRQRLVAPPSLIIAICAYVFERDRQQALEAGAPVFLTEFCVWPTPACPTSETIKHRPA